jgi:SAM-dependent methyltransferase
MQSIMTSEGGDDADIITARCKLIADTTAKLGLLNPFSYYSETIEGLARLPNVVFRPIDDICAVPKFDEKHIALRHDVDADIVTAVRCGRFLQEKQIPATFYILHTSHYYGNFMPGEGQVNFVRHSGFSDFLSELNSTGREIGIHNDALGVIFDHGADGVAHFQQELAWMRNQGVNIVGSAAHNSAAVYGAECFEIFKGLSVNNRGVMHWRGKSVPLAHIDMAALGLRYEGNHPVVHDHLDLGKLRRISKIEPDALRQPTWQKTYFVDHPIFERGYDYDAWLVASDTWILAGKGEVHYPLTRQELFESIEKLPFGARIVVSIHPIYVGERDAIVTVPTSSLEQTEETVTIEALKTVPAKFGFWWEKEESDLNWYDWMFQYRLGVHQEFVAWLKSQELMGFDFLRVLEVGCGRGVFYPQFFSRKHYTGLEYSKRNTEWLVEHRAWRNHDYQNADIANWASEEKFDLVFSSGTIDNVPDMDGFIRGMVKNSRGKIYLTAYRGWFPDLQDHKISWSDDTGAFYNDISPSRIEMLLNELGCMNIVIAALPTGRVEIPYETVISAEVVD